MLRQIIIVIVAVILLSLSFMWAFIIGKPKELPKKSDSKMSARLVLSTIAQNNQIQTKISIYGRLVPFEKTELYAEVGGMLLSMGKTFREGVKFNKDELLIRIEDDELQLNLRAQRSALLTSITQIMPDIKVDFSESLEQWDNYRKNFDVEKQVSELPKTKSSRERDFIALKNISNQYYNIKAQEERLSKYTIYAPFSGELTEANISTGSLIRAGQKIGTLMNTSVYELQTSVALTDLKFIKTGDVVTLKSQDIDGSWSGRISRISGSIDTKTQTVKVFIQVSGSNLRENMFLTGEINANILADVIEVPRKLLVEDDKIFTIVGDTALSLMTVQLSKISEETAMLRGVPNGTVLLQDNFPGAYDGMKVKTKK